MELMPPDMYRMLSSSSLVRASLQSSRPIGSMMGEMGTGAGRGGGGGGSIREAGGAFGKLEAAREDEYFYNLQKFQIEQLRKHIKDEMLHHQEQMKSHQEAVRRQEQKLLELQAHEKRLPEDF